MQGDMTETIELEADRFGSIELVCERSDGQITDVSLRTFRGNGEFGLLIDGLEPREPIRLYHAPITFP